MASSPHSSLGRLPGPRDTRSARSRRGSVRGPACGASAALVFSSAAAFPGLRRSRSSSEDALRPPWAGMDADVPECSASEGVFYRPQTGPSMDLAVGVIIGVTGRHSPSVTCRRREGLRAASLGESCFTPDPGNSLPLWLHPEMAGLCSALPPPAPIAPVTFSKWVPGSRAGITRDLVEVQMC